MNNHIHGHLCERMGDCFCGRLVVEQGFVFGFAGVGFLGAVDAADRVEAGAEHFLLPLSVTTTHGLDDIIQARFFLFVLLHICTTPLFYLLITLTKSSGRMMFSSSMASANRGAICSMVKPAMPQPMGVTRNFSSRCSRAKAINSST